MRTIRAAGCIVFVFLSVSSAGAVTGNAWKQLSETQRGSYVMGVIDGWHFVSALAQLQRGAKPTETEEIIIKVSDCVYDKRMPYSQVIAIVEKYMNDNPAEWHQLMSGVIWDALAKACDIIKK